MSLSVMIISVAVLFFGVVFFLIIKKNKAEKQMLKPDLTIAVESNDDDYCGIKLTNKGSGTAVIKKVEFFESNGNGSKHVSHSIDELFPFQKNYWMHNLSFSQERDYYLAGGESFYFGKLMKDKVLGRGISYLKLKDMFDEKVKDINIKIEFNDVFEKPQTPYFYIKN